MSASILDPRMIDPSKPLTIANTVLTNVTATEIVTPLGTSDQWNDTYSIVSTLSSTWEESADIIPTVTNYLSTNAVTIDTLTVLSVLSAPGFDTNAASLATVLNYLSTESVLMSSVVIPGTLSADTILVSNLTSLSTVFVTETIYASITALSSVTDTTFISVTSLSSVVDTVYIDVSSFNVSNLTAVNINATNQLLSAGADLLDLFSSINTGREDVNTIVISNSANWDSAYATVTSLSSDLWNDVYTNVQSNSGNWDSAYATVTSLSSDLWNDVYTNVQSNSATYATISFTDSKYLPTSGGTVTGSLSVLGDITYIDTAVAVVSAMFIDTNSTEPALRVTQTGPGDAILVEDSANPDSTPFVVNQAGSVGIGTTAPNEKLTVVGNISSTGNIFTSAGPVVVSSSTLETPTTGISAINNIVALSQATYDALTVKLPDTFYIIV